jgi:fructokinase
MIASSPRPGHDSRPDDPPDHGQAGAACGRPLVFGEVLFDRFPDGSEVLGGAPFNVAWHLQGFGVAPLLVSRIGADPAGERVLEAMRGWGMDTTAIQVDRCRATGLVAIELDDGQPRYRIDPDQAYGHIAAAPLDDRVRPALLYHGSLALWRAESRRAVDELVRRFALPVFVDVNLRPPWWQAPAVASWLDRATWAKLSLDELDRLAAGEAPAAERAAALCRQRRLQRVAVTLGGAGAISVGGEGECEAVRPAAATEVVDTVGAGDAFSAVLMLGLLAAWDVGTTLRRAQEFASAMVGVRGATVADPGFYQRFLAAWRA